jgi:hypothetical protein
MMRRLIDGCWMMRGILHQENKRKFIPSSYQFSTHLAEQKQKCITLDNNASKVQNTKNFTAIGLTYMETG